MFEGGCPLDKKLFLFPEKALREFCRQCFEKSGLRREEAEMATDVIVTSDMRGVDTHGVVRLPFYCRRLIAKGKRVYLSMRTMREALPGRRKGLERIEKTACLLACSMV
jgi:LDH2 family malate/lactate/ureidoglycolate dehydrogenase